MDNVSDMALLRRFAGQNSEPAFAALVTRHINLIYSTALRATGNPDAAEEITQAVLIVLARKAGRISEKTILAGWLYQTTRLTAASFLKSERRRLQREHQAYMQTEFRTAESDEAWKRLGPLLEDAMGALNDKERSAVVLRFFGGKTFAEVATEFDVTENAAKKKVGRALEKLHGYFSKRGVSSATAIIAGALSSNAVHAAPPAFARSAAGAALAKGAASSGSSMALAKGVLKSLAWTKLRGAVAAGGILMLVSTSVVTFSDILPFGNSSQSQKLPDGSILTLASATINQDNNHVLGVSGCLTAKLTLSGAPPESPLVSQDSLRYRPCRALVSGKDGLEYSSLLYAFSKYGNDYHGQFNTCLFPRDSSKLRIQIQQRDTLDQPWKTIAEFTCRQHTQKAESWQVEQSPISRDIDGTKLTFGEFTFQTGEPVSQTSDRDWENNWQSEGCNRTVTIPWQLERDGVLLTNWGIRGLLMSDSSGNESYVGFMDRRGSNNWTLTRTWESPDPRKVWKVRAEVAEESGFDPANIFTIRVPVHRVAPFETNVAGYPFRIQFFRGIDSLSTELLLTNRTDLRLTLLHAEDQDGRDQTGKTLGGDQFVQQILVDLSAGGELSQTFAIGKNISAEFTTKPRLIPGSEGK
jgi:RNA polymerase sigma factor (sigma-70 family)